MTHLKINYNHREDIDMIFVHFIIDNDGIEYHDYSWFKDYGLAHYEDSKSITDKDMIGSLSNINMFMSMSSLWI
jgi:hypothetical protein